MRYVNPFFLLNNENTKHACMKKNYRAILLVVLLPLAGCHLIDVKDIIHHPDKVPQLCDIKRLTYAIPFGEFGTATTVFYYNKWGNPDSITSNFSSTGHPYRHYFRYDQQRRLKEYLSVYANGFFQQYSRYEYDNKNRIIADSSYAFGQVINGQIIPTVNISYHFRHLYYYDAYDRMIRVEYFVGGNTAPYLFNYAFNAQGNVSDPDGSFGAYDNKANINRTHKIWMFLNRDYSINNRVYGTLPPAADYNKYGLPVKLPNSTNFLGLSLLDGRATYDCK